MVVKTKNFESVDLKPKSVPDGSSLEELVNVFLATLDQKNVLDVVQTSTVSGKYGVAEKHFAVVAYRE
jgi:hypothetical protein